MIDLIRDAFERFNREIETAILYTEEAAAEICKEKEKKFVGIWKTTANIEYSNQIVILDLLICFPEKFPDVLPKIYLDEHSYEATKYIPHIDTNRFICTFEENDFLILDNKKPFGVIKQCYFQAVKILEDGVNGKNYQDFEKEFMSYWDQKYSNSDDVVKNCLFILDHYTLNSSSDINISILPEEINGFSSIIHHNDSVYESFLENMEISPKKVVTNPVLFINDIKFSIPPYDYTSKELIKLINNKKSKERAKDYLLKQHRLPIILTLKQVSNKQILLGWFHKVPSLAKLKGFRNTPDSKWLYFVHKCGGKKINRIYPKIFSNQRLSERTEGVKYDLPTRLNLCFVGLGSIGSNLISLLKGFDVKKIILVDHDILNLENIRRHLLGFRFIKKSKTEAIKTFIKENDPRVQIITYNYNIIDSIINKSSEFRGLDCIICCIGNTSAENKLIDTLKSYSLDIPIFLLWVEPYLLAGHCLFLPKICDVDYVNDFYETGIFKFNVIKPCEYKEKSNIFSLTEAGCQISYMPYSYPLIIQFLSSIYRHIEASISGNYTNTVLFTWINKREAFEELGVAYKDDMVEFNQVVVRNVS